MVRRWFHCGDVISGQVDLYMTVGHMLGLVLFITYFMLCLALTLCMIDQSVSHIVVETSLCFSHFLPYCFF